MWMGICVDISAEEVTILTFHEKKEDAVRNSKMRAKGLPNNVFQLFDVSVSEAKNNIQNWLVQVSVPEADAIRIVQEMTRDLSFFVERVNAKRQSGK